MMLFIEPPCSKTSLGNPYCPLVLDVQLPAIRVRLNAENSIGAIAQKLVGKLKKDCLS